VSYKDKDKQRKYQHDWHKRRTKEYWRVRQTAKRKDIKEWVDSLKTKCAKCGYNRCIEALEFHHKDSNDKVRSISRMMRNNWGRKRILTEIKKCIILCANCHREQRFIEN
jgi:hypothetical protein